MRGRALAVAVGSGDRARSRTLPALSSAPGAGGRAPGWRRMERAGRAAYSEHTIEAIWGGPSSGGLFLGAWVDQDNATWVGGAAAGLRWGGNTRVNW